MDETTSAVDQGIAAADGPDKAREYADVKRWNDALKEAREHDEEARKQYARDRRLARGDSGFEVDSNLVGTNIDILENFLYAKDPDVDIQPARACQPPDAEALREAAEASVNDDPAVQQQLKAQAQEQAMQLVKQAAQAAATVGADPASIVPAVAQEGFDQALAQVTEEYVNEQVDAMRTAYAKRKRDADAYAETLEIIVSRLWSDAGLKPRGRRLVRSGLTIGVGVLKGSWQERTAPSPETTQAINDLQDNIKRAASTREQLDDASGAEADALMAQYQDQLAALKGQAEQVIARGFVVDNVAGENFQIPPGWAIASHLDAPWNADRIPMKKSEAMAHFGLDAERMKGAKLYTARKPVRVRSESVNALPHELEAKDADSFVEGNVGDASGGEWVMVWEIWDRESNQVLTLIEGLKCWAKPKWQPTPTTRFFPYFLYTTSEVDGERHPQSLVTRSAKLVDEYNRIGSAETEHRRRILPALMFDAGDLDKDSVKAITSPAIAAKVPVRRTNKNIDLRMLFAEVPYPTMNPEVYDRTRIVNELERIWGIQEALSGSISTEKTATEAEIQQSGFTARTGGRRDLLEGVLQELALYTAEVARKALTAEDVREIAGPSSIWPAYKGAADLAGMVNVEIRAGSSGKPNTTREREAWAAQLPVLQGAVMQVGQLRNSTPADIADSIEQLVRITAERSGDRINVDALLPKAGPPPAPMPMPPGMPGAPGAPPMPGDPNTPPPMPGAPADPAAPPPMGSP